MKMLRLFAFTVSAAAIAATSPAPTAAAPPPSSHAPVNDMCWFLYAPETGLTASTEPTYAIPRDLPGSYLGTDRDVLFGEHDLAAARVFMPLQRTHGELRNAVLFARDGQRVVLTHARVWSSERPNASGVQSEHLIAPDVRPLPVDLYRELPAADRALSERRIEQILERCAR